MSLVISNCCRKGFSDYLQIIGGILCFGTIVSEREKESASYAFYIPANVHNFKEIT
jgi:hypothetical protein